MVTAITASQSRSSEATAWNRMNFVKKPAKSGMPESEKSAAASTPANTGARSAIPRKPAMSSLPVRLYQATMQVKAARLVMT